MDTSFFVLLFSSPLPVALILLGVICIIIAIVGYLPSSLAQLNQSRIKALLIFGGILIVLAITSASLLALAPRPAAPTPFLPLPTATKIPTLIPTETVGVPTQTITPTVEYPVACDQLKAGETRKISPGTYIVGDITIDGIPRFDPGGVNNEGTVAYVEVETTVYAEWGAGCYTGSKNLTNFFIKGLFENGCDKVCKNVRFVAVQSDGQHEQFYDKAPEK